MFANKNPQKILASLFLSILIITAAFGSFTITKASTAGDDLLTFLGCDDDNNNGLNISDCVSSGKSGSVVSFTDFKGELKAPNAEGYAAGLTQAKDARTFILNVTNFALGFLGLIAVLVVIYGGVMSVTSAGDPEKAGKGKKAIGFAAIGLLIVMSSFAIVNTILLAPSGSEKGSSSQSAINTTTIRGVAGRQRFNYLAQQIEAVILRIYNGYQFHLTVKQQIENVQANILSFDESSCNTPFSSCVNQFVTQVNSQMGVLRNNINDNAANVVFKTGYIEYEKKIMEGVSTSLKPVREKIAAEDCDTSNKFAEELTEEVGGAIGLTDETATCHESDKKDIRNLFKTAKTQISDSLKSADFLTLSFSEDINYAIINTTDVYNKVKGLSSDSIGLNKFSALIPIGTSSVAGFSTLNTDMKASLKIGESLSSLKQDSIKTVLKNLIEIKSILENLLFVDAVISADVVEGNAPLIVNFSSVGSSDPSGLSIQDKQIEWDLNGDGDYKGTATNCVEAKGEGKSNATSSCIFTKPGTYRVTLKISPTQDATKKNPATELPWNQEIAPGISYIDVKVNPPSTKITLNVKASKGTTSYPVIEYDSEGNIKSERDQVYFSLSEAKAGLIFDATKTQAAGADYSIINDSQTKIRWNFGVPSKDNDIYQVPTANTLVSSSAIVYPEIGRYPVTFEVIDKNGVIDRKLFTVIVSNVAPRIINITPISKVGVPVFFDGSESTSDTGPIIFNWKIEKIPTVITTSYVQTSVINWLSGTAHAAPPTVDLKPSAKAVSAALKLNIPLVILEPGKRTEDNDAYICKLDKEDILGCTFKKAGLYRITLSLNDDGTAKEESTIINITSNPPTSAFRVKKLSDAIPSLYVLDGTSLSYDEDEKDNSSLEYSWEVNPSNCVFVGYYNTGKTEQQLINDVTDSISAQVPCNEALKEYSLDNSMPVVKLTQKGDFTVNLAVRTYDEPGLTSNNSEQTIKVDNVLDISWDEMKPSAMLAVTNAVKSDTNSDQLPGSVNTEPVAPSDQLPDSVNTEPVAPIEFKFKSSQAVSYEIDFGDGVTDSGEMTAGIPTSVTHNYTQTGKFKVKLSVFDADDVENSISRNVFIGNSDTPVAIIRVKVNGSEVQPQSITLGENGKIDEEGTTELDNVVVVNRKDSITFDSDLSINTDGTGRRLKYSWNIDNNDVQSSAKLVNHTFKQVSENGEPYIVKLKVTNDRDAKQSGEDNLNILVVGEAPTLRSLLATPDGDDLTTPVTVKLSAVGAVDPDGQITQYKWWYYNSKDEPNPENRHGLQITTAPTATINIGTNGLEGDRMNYKFGIEVTDNDNLSVSTDNEKEEFRLNLVAPEVQVVNGPNKAPIAKFTVDRTSISINERVNFASSSVDPDAGGGIINYKWDFGDGIKGENKASVFHEYTKANAEGYKVKLTVEDVNHSESTSDILRIFVDAVAQPPEAAFNAEQQTGTKVVKFTNTSSADTAAGAALKKYSWDFNTSTDTNGNGRSDDDVQSGDKDPTFTYSDYGTYRVKLIIEDDQGQTSSVAHTVFVKPPVAVKTAMNNDFSDGKKVADNFSSATKSAGANIFEASTKVDTGLLLGSIGAYAILFLISRNKQKNFSKK